MVAAWIGTSRTRFGGRDGHATLLVLLGGVVVGILVAAGLFLGPIGWIVAAALLGVFLWVLHRSARTTQRHWNVAAAGLVAGVIIYVTVGVIQNALDAPSSGAGSGSAQVSS